jgi:hypothetical protein
MNKMHIEFPDKEKIAEWVANGEITKLPEGLDQVEFFDMGVEALKTALDELSLEEYRPLEEYFEDTPPYHKLEPALLKELGIPTLMLITEDGMPLVILRIIKKDGTWLGEVKFDLMPATGYFTAEVLGFLNGLKSSGVSMTEEDSRIFIIRKTANLLKSAINKLNDRIEITIKSFLDEVFVGRAELWYQQHAESNSLQGFKMKRFAFSKIKEKTIKKHENDIREFWADDSSEELSDIKKTLLALHYKNTLEHWKEIERLQMEGKNWRRYVAAGDMSDVTDDLIEEFEKGTDLSGLALEHAARRAELFNVFDVKEQRLEKRRKGIKDSGYSRSRLFELRSEGEKPLENREISQSTAE